MIKNMSQCTKFYFFIYNYADSLTINSFKGLSPEPNVKKLKQMATTVGLSTLNATKDNTYSWAV